MPRGRPPGSPNVVDRWDDGRFSVVIYARADRSGYRIVSGFRGDKSAETTASTEEGARAVADVIWTGYQRGDVVAPDPAPLTIAALGEAVAAHAERPKTQRSYRQVWGLFARHVGINRAPKAIYRLDVVDFLSTVEAGTYSPKDTCSPQTLLTYHRTLKAGFNWAISKRWIAANPCHDIELDTTHVMGPWLPYSEWEPYLTQCWRVHQIRSGFVLETAMREAELCFARKAWLRGEVGRRGIYIGPDPITGFRPKGAPRVVPLTDKAEWWLQRAAEAWPKEQGELDWLFSADGLSATSNLARETREAVRLSGVTPTTFHGLRRSAGAHWLDCGLTIYEVSKLLGHKDVETTLRWYADVSDSTLVAAIAKVERVRREDAANIANTEAPLMLGSSLWGRR